MDPKVNYTAVGVFVIVLTLGLVALIYWLSAEHHKSYNSYLIYMKEGVSGLNVKSPVRFNGVDVGHVDKIGIDPEDPQEVRLVVKVEKSIPITQATVATLMAQGITGITYVGLKSKTPRAPLLVRQEGEPYPVIPSEPSFLVQLNTALRDVTEGLKNISLTFNQVFDKENKEAIKKTLDNLSKASEQFPDMMQKIRTAAQGLTLASAQFKTTLQTGNTILQSGKTILENGNTLLLNGNMVLNNLSQQTLPEIYQASTYLKDTLSNLKYITTQMKQNPSVLIRGTQPLPRGPGE